MIDGRWVGGPGAAALSILLGQGQVEKQEGKDRENEKDAKYRYRIGRAISARIILEGDQKGLSPLR